MKWLKRYIIYDKSKVKSKRNDFICHVEEKNPHSSLGLRTLKVRTNSTINNIPQDFTNYEDQQSIRFSIRYTFGNNNIKSKSVRSSNQEEKQRVN